MATTVAGEDFKVEEKEEVCIDWEEMAAYYYYYGFIATLNSYSTIIISWVRSENLHASIFM
jgi:hypothetical protein